MVLFLANRGNLQARRLHERIKRKISSEFGDVQQRRTTTGEAGAYRTVGKVDPRRYLETDDYPVTRARLEIGFALQTPTSHEYYWFNWIEPDRGTLVGWHQDDTHDELGTVHIQVNDRSGPVDRQPARFIDSHPMNVVEQRLASFPDAVLAVQWDGKRPIGFDPAASLVQ